MRISKHIHSCLFIEEGGTRILVDPGIFSFIEGLVKPEQFTNLSAIFITHNHRDHADPEALKIMMEHNPSAVVYGNADTKNLLAEKHIPVEIFEEGMKEIDHITIEAFPATHEKIMSKAPQNTAYLFNKKFLITGDSLDPHLEVHKGVRVLAFTVAAPWANQRQLAEFGKLIAPKIAIPIHDGFLKEFFLPSQYYGFKEYFAEFGTEFHPLESRETLDIS